MTKLWNPITQLTPLDNYLSNCVITSSYTSSYRHITQHIFPLHPTGTLCVKDELYILKVGFTLFVKFSLFVGLSIILHLSGFAHLPSPKCFHNLLHEKKKMNQKRLHRVKPMAEGFTGHFPYGFVTPTKLF